MCWEEGDGRQVFSDENKLANKLWSGKNSYWVQPRAYRAAVGNNILVQSGILNIGVVPLLCTGSLMLKEHQAVQYTPVSDHIFTLFATIFTLCVNTSNLAKLMTSCYFRSFAVAIQYGKKEISRGTSGTYVLAIY